VRAVDRWIGLVLLVAAASGCRAHAWLRRSGDNPPVLFSALPSGVEVAAAVNAHTARVQTLQSRGAKLSVPGAPSISAEVALARPRHLRVTAGTQLGGPELDLGSNDELFWLWVARMPEPAVFYARHDQFAVSPARKLLAIEPLWLIEALGLIELDPESVVEGPLLAGRDRIELRLRHTSPEGPVTRLVRLHARYGWVLEQHVLDDSGRIVASAVTSGHQFHAVDGVALPHRLEVQVPASGLRWQLEIDRWAVNQPLGDREQLFALPRQALARYPLVDLADPQAVLPWVGRPQEPATPPASSAVPSPGQAGIPRRLRGYSQWR
jgi:hypothetical protein